MRQPAATSVRSPLPVNEIVTVRPLRYPALTKAQALGWSARAWSPSHTIGIRHMSTETAQLYTFWVSHFSEKARWCLQFEGVSFVDHHLLPGPHVGTVRKLAKRQQVPVLTYEGEVIQGSAAIVDAIPRLFGKTRLQPWSARKHAGSQQAQSQHIEKMADECFGRAVQALGYDALLRDRRCMVSLWGYHGPWWAGAYYAVAFPLMAKFVRRSYCGDAAAVAKSRETLLAGLRQTDELLQGQDYLLGEGPTRTDLSVAALLSPFVRPKEHPMKWPSYPDELEEFCGSLEGRPTWDFALRMYRDHR